MEKAIRREVIEHKVNIAIQILFKNDPELLENDVNERSITHKLAEYLQTQFSGCHVDCEYNKNGKYKKELDGLKKALEGIPECANHIKTERVFPDIIIHLRGKQEANLLVIEIKKKINPNSSKCDEKKLELFTQKGQYHYLFGLFIKFNRTNEPEFKWFENGEEIQILTKDSVYAFNHI